MYKNTQEAYGSIAKFLHWFVSLLIFFMLALGYYMSNWGGGPLYNIHKVTGLFVLILVLARIIWVIINPRPKLRIHPFERVASHIVQGLLYICILVMPLSGWAGATAYGYAPHIGSWMIPMPGIPINQALASQLMEIHVTTAILLMVLIALHIAGSLKHHFVDQDVVLTKMLPSRRSKEKPPEQE